MPEPVARERHFTSSDNLRLFFSDWGDKDSPATPVLCLPGLTRNSRDFATLARNLSPRRVICPDLRGRGRSPYAADWRSYEPAVYIDDMRHLMAALGLGKVIILGTSMGGLLGMGMATAFPTALAGLILNDVGPGIETSGAGRILAYVAEDRPVADWPAAVKHLRDMFPNLSLAVDDDWLAFARGTFREDADKRLHFDWDVKLVRPLLEPAEPPPDLWALWRAVHAIPTLAIRGGASDILSAETFQRMKADKPDLVQVTLPGVGHAPTLTDPQSLKAIDDFLKLKSL
ncbi:MAG TPA: alpha/beta hydrolase [Alphaproteobacteria bacterium]